MWRSAYDIGVSPARRCFVRIRTHCIMSSTAKCLYWPPLLPPLVLDSRNAAESVWLFEPARSTRAASAFSNASVEKAPGFFAASVASREPGAGPLGFPRRPFPPAAAAARLPGCCGGETHIVQCAGVAVIASAPGAAISEAKILHRAISASVLTSLPGAGSTERPVRVGWGGEAP